MSEDIIFEEQQIKNKGLENVLQKTLEFNQKYLEYLEQKLEEMKTKNPALN